MTPVLPALKMLILDERSASAGPDGGQRLVAGPAEADRSSRISILSAGSTGVIPPPRTRKHYKLPLP